MGNVTKKMDDIILGRAKELGVVGIPSAAVSHMDIPVIIIGWADMISDLAKEAELSLDKDKSAKLALAVSKSGLTMLAGMKTVSTVLSWTGVGLPFAAAVNGGANYYFTKNLGYRVAGILTRDHIRDTDVFSTLVGGLGVGTAIDNVVVSNDIIENLGKKGPS